MKTWIKTGTEFRQREISKIETTQKSTKILLQKNQTPFPSVYKEKKKYDHKYVTGLIFFLAMVLS